MRKFDQGTKEFIEFFSLNQFSTHHDEVEVQSYLCRSRGNEAQICVAQVLHVILD